MSDTHKPTGPIYCDRGFVVGDHSSFGIGTAIELLKAGVAITRLGWNGKGMRVYVVDGKAAPDQKLPYMMLLTADNKHVPWNISQTDAFATDYRIFEQD